MELKVVAILFSLIPFLCNGLPTDCNPAELEQLNLDGLLEVANISQNCLNAAADVFKSKYAHEKIVIDNTQRITLNRSESFYGFEKVQNTLKYFGHLIERLHLHEGLDKICNASELQDIEVLRAINRHCSKTLQELQIIYLYCELDIFNEIIGPFEKVENITFEFHKKLQTDNVKLNQVFPHVKKMLLGFVEVTDPEFVDHVYPHLEHFGASNWLFKNDTEPFFENIIQKNPQIKTLNVIAPTRTALRYANEQLPDLEKLELLSSVMESTDTDEIHFKNVWKFDYFDGHWTGTPKNFTFEDLREIELTCSACRLDNEAYEFLFENQNLQKLAIWNKLEDTEVQRFAGKFKHLSEAFFGIDWGVNAETVVHFVKASEKLNKLTLNRHGGMQFESELKYTELAADFNISINSEGHIVIDRKIPV